jgi:hypothetical protein
MEIKRFFISEPEKDGQRRELNWEDEHGIWPLGRGESQNGVAQGFLPAVMDGKGEIYPETGIRTIYQDYLGSGEEGASFDSECIVNPMIIEAYRRWTMGWYDEVPAGDIEMPVPGIWQFEWGKKGVRVRDA